MKTFRYKKLYGRSYLALILGVLTLCSLHRAAAQTTIATGISNSTSTLGTTNATITWAVENTNATAVTLTAVDFYRSTTSGTGTYTLWYSATSLSGTATIATPTWTSITSVSASPPATTGIYPLFTGLSFTIPAATTYRFAIVAGTNQLAGGGATTTPNTHSGGGVNLYRGNYQIAGANVGYMGGATNVSMTPRFFMGAITFTAAVVNPCTGTPTARTLTASAASVCAGSSVTLTSAGQTTGSGVFYQLQSRPAGSTGPWTTVSSASMPAASTTAVVTQDTEYRLNDSCGSSMGTAASNVLTVVANPQPSTAVTTTGATTFCQGGSVLFSAATGAGFSYQWMLNGGNIPAAMSSSYTVSAGGSYTVAVSTLAACSDTSAAAVVTVNPLPLASVSTSGPLSFCQGDSSILIASAGAGLSYQWMLNGVNIASATASNHVAKTAGTYTVMVSDANGCSATSSPVIVTVAPAPVPVITQSGPGLLSTGIFATYQWYRNGQLIPGATSATYTATQNGAYTVMVTSPDGCRGISAALNITTIGVEQVAAETDVLIFPNPTADWVHISGAALNVAVYSGDGRLVLEKPATNGVDLRSLADGIYTIKVTNNQGVRAVRKLQKQAR